MQEEILASGVNSEVGIANEAIGCLMKWEIIHGGEKEKEWWVGACSVKSITKWNGKP